MKIKKLLLVALTAFTLSGVLTACGKGGETSDSEPPVVEGGQDDSLLAEGTILAQYKAKTGLHEYTIKAGSDYIENYKILISDETEIRDEIEYAANEIQHFIGEAAGFKLEIVENADYDEAQKYISIGETKAYKNAAIDFSSQDKLGRSGVLIKSDKKNVYLLGGHVYGIKYSAYEFLKHEIGFEAYGADQYTFTPKTKLKVHNFNLIEVPDIELRIATHGNVANSNEVSSRMRFNNGATNTGDVWMAPDPSYPYHNTFKWWPKEKYLSTHPEWYMDTQEQPCFLAHGDEESQEEMFQVFWERFIQVLEDNPKCTTISITQEDRNTWCKCDACSELFDKYGTDAASVIMFCNRVSDTYEAYKKEHNIDRNIDILFFAYHKTTDAPAVKDLNGEWKPIDENVICRPNVGCFYAPIYADYRGSMNHERNKGFYDIMEKWTACSDIFYLWFYGTNFNNYLMPINNFPAMADNYKLAYKHGAVYMYDQGQWNQSTSTGFAWLKQYLQSKLQWNVDLDQNQLTTEFFKNWFGKASEPMQELFDRWHSKTSYLYQEEGEGITIYTDSPDKAIFPKADCDAYLDCIDRAYAAIEPLKETDVSTYMKLESRILLESISWRYIDYVLYASYYSLEERTAMWAKFKEDVETLGISHLAETRYISDLWPEY